MAKAKSKAPADMVALYDALIATNPEVEQGCRQRLHLTQRPHVKFSRPKGELSLRLGKEGREAFLAEFDTRLSEQYGAVIKEYVIVPDAPLSDTSTVKKYFDMSFQYVGSLKPKPTTKPK